MTSISGVSGASSSGWANAIANRAPSKADMFAKVDSNGDGQVDETELATMLQKVSSKSGVETGDASTVMSQLDTDGNGTLSEAELEAGMKDILPPPTTMEFAHAHGAHGAHGPKEASTSDESEGVSTSELDTNGDNVITPQEIDAFVAKLSATLDAGGASSSGSSSSSSSSSSGNSSFDEALARLAELVKREYSQFSSSQVAGASTLSVTA